MISLGEFILLSLIVVSAVLVKTTLHIEYTSMTASEGADVYHFNETQREQMHTLLSSDFDELWEALVE